MADPDNGKGEAGRQVGSDDANLSARLKSLDARLGHAAGQRSGGESRTRATSDASAIGQAFRLSAEFVAGPIAGGAIGWTVDMLFGTSPWGLIVLLILGFLAGMLNLLRAAGLTGRSKVDEEIMRQKGAGRDINKTDQR